MIHLCDIDISEQIGCVLEFLQSNKVFLDAPCADKAPKDAHTTRFIVRTTGSGSTERLLANHCARTLFIIVDVASRIAKSVRRLEKGYTILSEATLCEYQFLNQQMRLVLTWLLWEHRLKWYQSNRESAHNRCPRTHKPGKCSGLEKKSKNPHTVTTGPKISSFMVIERGSLVRITVGWTKKPLESSAEKHVKFWLSLSKGWLTWTTNQDFATRILRFLDITSNGIICTPSTIEHTTYQLRSTTTEIACSTYMTGPTKLSHWVQGPTLIFAISSRNCVLNPFSQIYFET